MTGPGTATPGTVVAAAARDPGAGFLLEPAEDPAGLVPVGFDPAGLLPELPPAGFDPETTEPPVACAGVLDVSTGITTTTVVVVGPQPVVHTFEVVVMTGAMLVAVTSPGQ